MSGESALPHRSGGSEKPEHLGSAPLPGSKLTAQYAFAKIHNKKWPDFHEGTDIIHRHGQKLMVSDSRVSPADIAPCAPEAADVIRRITHDLRGPLRSIRQIAFYLDVALPAADSRSRKRLLALQRQVMQARWILDDAVLSLAAAPPRCTIVDMKEVVSQALLAWQVEDTAWLFVEYADELPLVRVDVAQIEQLIRRIVLFFAADARRATRVRCCAREGDVAVEITPPGSVEIPPALLEPADGGPGTRLAAARKVIDSHAARVEVDRDSDDQVTLRIVFPAAA